MKRLLSQERGAYALSRVQEAGKDHEYARFCRNLPAMLLQNGLGQSLAFLRSKRGEGQSGAKAAGKLYADLSGWLMGERRLYDGEDLIRAVMDGDRKEYMAANEEALEFSGWLKRFADALIGREDQ